MAIKAGQVLHDAQGFVIDRIQTGGVSSLNIPEEIIYETGNYESVGIVRDIPDLTFEVQSWDVVPEMEAIIVGADPTAANDGDLYQFTTALPLDIVSPFKVGAGAFTTSGGVVVPYNTLESVAYRFGVTSNAEQTFTFKTDTINYVAGTPYTQNFTITAGTNQVYTLAHTAVAYSEGGNTLYALSACATNPATGAFKRLFIVTDYTNTSTTVTTLANLSTQGYTDLNVTYASATAATYNQAVHQGTSVKPAAVRGKDISVEVSDGAATPVLSFWRGVQSVDATWRVTLDNNREFNNQKYVSSDYDVPQVSGSIVVRSVDAADLIAKVKQIAVTSDNVTGLYGAEPLELKIVIKDPLDGTPLKTIDIPDAYFTPPAVSVRANTKLDVTFTWTSLGGLMDVYKGTMP
jgi:hypothetical protein